MAVKHRSGFLAAVAFMALLVVPWPGASASSGSLAAFLQEVEAAYSGYKMAWFYTRRGSAEVAVLELDEFRAAWATIVARYGAAPPGPFATDAQWGASLDRVGSIAKRAAAESEAGKLRAAHETLGPIRDELSALRRRSGVTVFSDIVDAYGREVQALNALGRRLDAATPEALADFHAASKRLRSALLRIRSDRPAKLAADAGFGASVRGNFQSLAKLDRGIAARHVRAIRGSIRSIRADYVLLFVRYG